MVSYFLPDGDSVHEISIVPRGMAGVIRVAGRSELYVFRLKARIANTLAGYCAEKLVFGGVTTGPNSDKSTDECRAPHGHGVWHERRDGPVFLGGDRVLLEYDFAGARELRRVTRGRWQIRRLLEGHGAVLCDFQDHMRELEALVEILLEREKVDNDEFTAVMEDRLSAEAYAGGRRGNPPESEGGEAKLLLLKKRQCKRKTRR